MISDFREYHRLASYLSRYTREPIGLPVGVATLRSLFDETYYADLDGGILESFGRLFRQQLKLLIYPLKNRDNGEIERLDSIRPGKPLDHLFDYLCERQCLVPLDDISYEYLDIHSPEVLGMIERGDDAWIGLVPECAVDRIVQQKLFGYAP
jgi:hypothetical protein